ncbi:MAG: DUF1028 domain-containing protein [Pseudomonadota bacterium]|nr:MAG: DUF1028 domain-containing protein [Pseudomonadota bacterium]
MRMPIALVLVVIALCLGVTPGSGTTAAAGGLRPVHTYSIVARDPKTGQLGVAVQSHWFSIGTLVPWAEAGVGAVATQSFVDVRYGASGLDLMRAGWSATRALAALREADPHPEVRQVAMIDAKGNIAAHTGGKCIQHAGHLIEKNFSVQANLMVDKGVPQAMAGAFRTAEGSLAERLLATLEAAQATGGDLRGKQSAAILVVRGEPTGRAWEDRIVDLHVEDHPAPLKELGRLLRLHRAYGHMNRGDLAIEQDDVDGALREYGAAQALVPDNLEMKFWHAVSLVNADRLDESLPIFRTIFAGEKRWRLMVERLALAGLLIADKATIDRILAVAPM